MVATSAHHIVRVTVRIDVAAFHRDIDITLPTSSSFAEILPELARLVDLPAISRPWEVTTVAGAVLDPARPLYQQRLRDGQVVVLRPREPVTPPVVRDAAESLAATADEGGRAHGLDAAAACAGAVMVYVLVGMLFGALPAVGAAAVSLFPVAAVARSRVLFALSAVATAAAAGWWVAGPRGEWVDVSEPALGVLAGALALLAAAGGGAVIKLVDARLAAILSTTAVLLAAGAAAAWLPVNTAPAAAVVLAGLAAVILTPGIATRASGIAIPRVPTAGETFAVADDYQADVDDRSRVARRVTTGIASAVSLCVLPALARLGLLGGGWVYVFCLCVAGALLVHSFRHHGAGPRVALALCALGAVVASSLAAANAVEPHPVWVGFAFFTAALTLTAPMWSARVPDLEPTTLVWLERTEMAAIIAVFPLGVHLLGVFDLIRGL
ncbi:type VII secretion integral membrane protein EccD [Corynebacterium qintianiae]|uniref:Type VII secretion integral membrane protein EccD n=1 Tax=Corynebacterium qintianiae TaxID=2709392 RepID=A0A7T0KMU8_9CORY|nr:type VII secretion integral membrane protein EccD [Corynebacterium qintianiae]QPK83570.1 type VII secretion integral membrane protein EccD [Corynebacterium qintianiae]